MRGVKMSNCSSYKVMVLSVIFLIILGGCSAQNFNLKDLAKSDMDEVADHHYKEIESLLRELTIKLYKRNPKYLNVLHGNNNELRSIDFRLKQIFDRPGKSEISEISKYGTEAVELALDNNYGGDRVLAFMAGLTDMIKKSYGYNTEFFIYTELKEQDLYLSARNLEIAFWRLTSYRNLAGEPFILSNSRGSEIENLSYERIFGKMIALQDMLARISSGKNNRMLKTVVQNVATKAFFPF